MNEKNYRFLSRVNSRGATTIPIILREILKIKKGDVIDLEIILHKNEDVKE